MTSRLSPVNMRSFNRMSCLLSFFSSLRLKTGCKVVSPKMSFGEVSEVGTRHDDNEDFGIAIEDVFAHQSVSGLKPSEVSLATPLAQISARVAAVSNSPIPTPSCLGSVTVVQRRCKRQSLSVLSVRWAWWWYCFQGIGVPSCAIAHVGVCGAPNPRYSCSGPVTICINTMPRSNGLPTPR